MRLDTKCNRASGCACDWSLPECLVGRRGRGGEGPKTGEGRGATAPTEMIDLFQRWGVCDTGQYDSARGPQTSRVGIAQEL